MDPLHRPLQTSIALEWKKTVLFRERFYSKGPLNHQQEAALNALAIQKAKHLGVDLVSMDDKLSKLYGSDLNALGGTAAHEYIK